MKQSEVNHFNRLYERRLKTLKLQGKAKKNIVSNGNGLVTFKYIERKTGKIRYRILKEEACAKAFSQVRWPESFYRPRCGCKKFSYITTRKMHQCSKCKYLVSLTTGILFHATNLPLVKWSWAIYLTATDKGGISALRLSKQTDVS